MTPREHLMAYCQLILHGYTPEEASKIIDEIKEKMKEDKQ